MRSSESNQEPEKESPPEKELSSEEAQPLQNQELADSQLEKSRNQGEKRKPGKQPGAEGKWRSQPLVAEETIPHYPEHCASCNQKLNPENHKPYMGYYVLELKTEKSGFQVVCQLHHYYELGCECGHKTKASPGEGYISCVDGRATDLKLTEYVLVGPLLATLIASLSVRYRMSRAKIQEFLCDWAGTELSVGTIDRCIREAGIACAPVVEKLIEEIQKVEVLHLDETPTASSRKTSLVMGGDFQ